MDITDKLGYSKIERLIRLTYGHVPAKNNTFMGDLREVIKINMFRKYHMTFGSSLILISDFNGNQFVPFFNKEYNHNTKTNNVTFKRCDLSKICFTMKSEINTVNLIFVSCKIGLMALNMGKESVTKLSIVNSYVHLEFDDFIREMKFKYHKLEKITVINSHFGETLVPQYTWTRNN